MRVAAYNDTYICMHYTHTYRGGSHDPRTELRSAAIRKHLNFKHCSLKEKPCLPFRVLQLKRKEQIFANMNLSKHGGRMFRTEEIQGENGIHRVLGFFFEEIGTTKQKIRCKTVFSAPKRTRQKESLDVVRRIKNACGQGRFRMEK